MEVSSLCIWLILGQQIENGKKCKFDRLLYEFKLGRKAVGTTRNINKAFGEETVMERTARHWFRRFRNGNESIEDEETRVLRMRKVADVL
uniref:HTH_48 domain-containing protein n=1 Tax=Heterorhabditis bacteriophora TaxID=37862 RepID=A0A1I7XB29_HETBA